MSTVQEIQRPEPSLVTRVVRSSRERMARFYLNRSLGVFDSIVDDYWSAIKPNRDIAPNKGHFDSLQGDGVCIVPNYASDAELAAIRGEIKSISGFHDGSYSGSRKFVNMPHDGICSAEITPDLPTCWAKTAGNKDHELLAKALFGDSVHLSGVSVNKYGSDKINSSNVPHWDDWRIRFKTFLYISDVTERDAPMIYIKGSHKDVPWRREKDFASNYMPKASAGGSWWPVEQLGLQKVSCVGKAGTLVIFDARGIHAGTQLIQGPRVMLMTLHTTHKPFGFMPF